MKINYDKIADAIYITLRKGKISRTVKMNDRMIVDMSKKGDILGIELLDTSSKQGIDLQKSLKNGVPVTINSGTLVLA